MIYHNDIQKNVSLGFKFENNSKSIQVKAMVQNVYFSLYTNEKEFETVQEKTVK